MYMYIFFHSFIYGHLRCLCLSAVVADATVNVVYRDLFKSLFSVFWETPKGRDYSMCCSLLICSQMDKSYPVSNRTISKSCLMDKGMLKLSVGVC